jgi:hypothetical protein
MIHKCCEGEAAKWGFNYCFGQWPTIVRFRIALPYKFEKFVSHISLWTRNLEQSTFVKWFEIYFRWSTRKGADFLPCIRCSLNEGFQDSKTIATWEEMQTETYL